MKKYTDRTVDEVCFDDFSMSPLEYALEYCLTGWDMTVEQVLNELYGQEPADQLSFIEEGVATHLADKHGYVWRHEAEE